MKAFFYVQHLLGIGHLKRAAILARALRAAGFDVTLASGGMPVAGIPVSLQLPPVRAVDLTFKALVDAAGRPVDAGWQRARAGMLVDAWRAAAADVLVVELFPFGRRQMRFELLPLLEDARRLPRRPLIVSSVRDVINANPAREEEAAALAERFFDRILVHGDERVAPFGLSFGLAERLGPRLHYTGYVVDDAPAAGEAGSGEVLVSAGGGAVGFDLLATAARARQRTALATSTWRLLAGLNATPRDLAALEREAPPGVIVERSRADFHAMLSVCALSVSQAGYNTAAETLQSGVRAVLVPFSAGGESEQALRARLLAERGAVQMVAGEALSVDALAAAVDRAARGPKPDAGLVRLDGARTSAALVRGWLA